MPQHRAPTRSPGIISLAWLFGNVAFSAITWALTYPFRTTRAPTFHKDVLNAVIRALLSHMTIPQTRYLNGSTTQRYLDFSKARKRDPKSIEVKGRERKVVAHWIGDPDAQSVMLYLHGGAYFQPATPGLFLYLDKLIEDLNYSGKTESIAALMLAYSLAPEATYPTQLQEAATMLQHVIESTGRSPSNIFLSGDSAGGNIALGLLSHLLHPHPEVSVITLHQPLAGVLLYSPVPSWQTDSSSFRRNQSLDMLPVSEVRNWGAMFLGKNEAEAGSIVGDAYSEPSLNPSDWWRGMHRTVGHILVVSGGDEIMADAIRQLSIDMKEGWTEEGGDKEQIKFIETPREAHIGPIVDFMASGKKETECTSQVAVEEWYKARLENRN